MFGPLASFWVWILSRWPARAALHYLFPNKTLPTLWRSLLDIRPGKGRAASEKQWNSASLRYCSRALSALSGYLTWPVASNCHGFAKVALVDSLNSANSCNVKNCSGSSRGNWVGHGPKLWLRGGLVMGRLFLYR